MESVQEKSDSKTTTSDVNSIENDEAAKYLEHLLKNGINEEATDDELSLPPWYDEELFTRAQQYYDKYLFALFGAMMTGLIAVIGIPTILDVLCGTKQSGTVALSYRRYISTIFHVKCWYQSPLKPDSDSWRSLQKVRKAHFKSSKICSKANCGKVTQKDLAITQFGFAGFITTKGRIQNHDFYEANIHFWRVIGYMIGIKDEYNLCTDSVKSTKPRMELMLSKVYRPALENTTKKFENLTQNLIDGLWYLNSLITYNSSIFIAKWLTGCKGFEYFKTDFQNESEIPKDGLSVEYKKLNLWDRFIVNYIVIVTLYLYNYNLVRIYLNFRVKLSLFLMYYFPFLAFLRFGISWSYVRIFDKSTKLRNE